MSLMAKDNKLLKKCNTVWNKVINLMKKEFDSETVW